jgi:Short C-terminal domain
MGLFSKSINPSEDLQANGLRGKATVLTATMKMGMSYEGSMSSKKTEELLSGQRAMTKYRLELRIEVPGQSTYEETITVPVPMPKVSYMTGGSIIPVFVDPNKPSHIAVDWNGEFQRGTVQQMADANPMIAAALQGAGVDVAAISAMQAQALAAGGQPGNVIIGGQLYGGAGAPMPVTPAAGNIWGPASMPPPPSFPVGGTAPAATPAATPDDDRIAKLEKLAKLRDSGALSDTEFETEKARILSE